MRNTGDRQTLPKSIIAFNWRSSLADRHGLFRLQFSLRAILVVTSLMAMYFAHAARQDAERRLLITEIEDVGGTVKIDETLGFTLFQSARVTDVNLPYSSVGQIKESRLKAFANLSSLGLLDFKTRTAEASIQATELRFTTITDEMLDRLGAEPPEARTR